MTTPMIRRAGPYVVKSRADGTLHIEPAWSQGLDGFPSRMALADEIADVLNRRAGKATRVSGGT